MSHQGIFSLFIFNLLWNGRREMQTWRAQQRKEGRRGECVRPTRKHAACFLVVSRVSLVLSKQEGEEKKCFTLIHGWESWKDDVYARLCN